MVSRGPGSARKARFDALKLAAEGDELSGQVDARSLERIADRLATGEASIDWRIVGGHDEMKRPVLDVSIAGTLPMLCQRCLQSFALPIEQTTRLLLARDEAEAKRLDAEESEVLPALEPLDARGLVEDELLLSLPFAPHHADGQCPPGAGLGHPGAHSESRDAHSPFDALAGLKHRR
jgi:uncharacterized protein